MENKGIVTIDTNAVVLAKDDAGKFAISKDAEAEIEKILAVQKLIEEVLNFVKEKLGQAMDAEGLKKIEGERITVSKRFYGERYELVDKEMAVSLGFAKITELVKADSKAIDEYAKENGGNIPEGVALKERNESVIISRAEDDK